MTRKQRKGAPPVPALPRSRFGAPVADTDRGAESPAARPPRARAAQDAAPVATRKRRPRFVF